jgi:hypothetical protein
VYLNDPPHFHRNSPDCTLENAIYPIYIFVFFLLLFLSHLWASIKLLDVNEVAIIMIILGEPKRLNF